MKKSIVELSDSELEAILSEMNEPRFRRNQIRDWVYKGKEIAEMKNIPGSLREKLSRNLTSNALSIEARFYEKSSNTTKYLLKTKDDILIESVLLEYDNNYTVCVSTQAGCRMHCSFCVSGKDGLIRSLTRYEMLSELLCIMGDKNCTITNIVLMGSGEPFDNYNEVMAFIRLLNDEKILNIGIRHITLSTCGIVPGIERLTEEGPYINLSLSMHSAIPEKRRKMMPVENAYSVVDAVKACEKYRKVSKRRITYEYCVVENVNDRQEDADAVKKLIGQTDSLINLIGVNEGADTYKKNAGGTVEEFAKKLKKHNINCTIRRKLGSSINAACGQLRCRYQHDNKGERNE